MIDAINAVTAADELSLQPTAVVAPESVPTDFSTFLSRELGSVNDKLINADTQVRRLAVGETQNLHETMIALEQAKLSFELVVQVRNRILEAYQDIMRMQV
ncbi:MAG: flagellar hook-basal body complex protein FliE [Gammaproteobacteria bacterium]|nr:flagellar hook-basal body complex protein FliE [Gammaproteobacteria bacterium]